MNHDVDVWDRIVAEARRLVQAQIDQRAAAFEAAASLLRLAVASLAGTIAIVGLLLGADIRIPLVAGSVVTGGVTTVLLATVQCALVPVGRPGSRDLIVGPNLRAVVVHADQQEVPAVTFARSLALAAPEWVEANLRTLVFLHRLIARGLALLVLGVVLILLEIAFVAGGHILA